jgi:hypothetical protein
MAAVPGSPQLAGLTRSVISMDDSYHPAPPGEDEASPETFAGLLHERAVDALLREGRASRGYGQPLFGAGFAAYAAGLAPLTEAQQADLRDLLAPRRAQVTQAAERDLHEAVRDLLLEIGEPGRAGSLFELLDDAGADSCRVGFLGITVERVQRALEGRPS